MSNDTTLNTPILIVGGGPVGSALAIELGWRDIPCMVLEKGDGTVDHPRLGIILTRTMEFCRRWGIVDRVYNCGFNNDYRLNVVYCTSMSGFTLGRDLNNSCNEMPLPQQSPVKRQRCPQIWFNPILEKAAREYPIVDYRHYHKLVGFEDHGDYVIANCEDTRTNETVSIRARYLVAADGAASQVRSQLDIKMLGKPVLSYSMNIFIRSPELILQHDKGEAERYIFIGKNGTWANLTVVDGRELWRITIIGNEQMMNLDEFDPMEAVRRCLGSDSIPFELISVKPWRRTELTAEHFRKGNVFLVGDAAHTMSPTGGHGMSTGVADAIDLGWKLEAILKGWGGDHLLDSYEQERRPIAALAAAASASNFCSWVSVPNCEEVLTEGPEGESCRESVGAHMLRVGREDWDSLGLQLGYRYEQSSICISDGTSPPPFSIIEYEQTSCPGSRAPHVWLEDGRSTLDLFGRGFVLLRLASDVECNSLEQAASQAGVPLTVVSIIEPNVQKQYVRKLVLVRPDGFVAWRGDSLPSQLQDFINTVRGARVQFAEAATSS